MNSKIQRALKVYLEAKSLYFGLVKAEQVKAKERMAKIRQDARNRIQAIKNTVPYIRKYSIKNYGTSERQTSVNVQTSVSVQVRRGRPKAYNPALIHFYLQKHSTAETARLVGCCLGTVYNHMHRPV